jgi:hypothetical protein
MFILASAMPLLRIVGVTVLITIIAVGIQVAVVLLMAACLEMPRFVRLVRTYCRMRAERDQARAAFEAVTKTSELRAEAARRMADFTWECR